MFIDLEIEIVPKMTDGETIIHNMTATYKQATRHYSRVDKHNCDDVYWLVACYRNLPRQGLIF